MATRSTRITLVNDTDEDLTLTSSSLDHGEWSDGFESPVNIGPHAAAVFQSESAGFMTGTEGTVTYAIGGDGDEITVHWDNPFAGSNTHWESLSHGFELTRTGHDDANAELELTLQPSTPHLVEGFVPSVNGFHFANSWPAGTTVRTIEVGPVSVPIGDAANGLCGGMVFAALDYFEEGSQPPAQTQAPAGEGDPLFDYLVDRLFDSFDLPSLPLTLMKLMDPLYPDTDQNVLNPVGLANGRAFAMAREAWPQIRDAIDSGHPCPIALVKVISANPFDLGQNHQVLVYGYQVDGTVLTLWIYDPNEPDDDDVRMVLDIARTDVAIAVDYQCNNPPSPDHAVRCFVTTAYAPKSPPAS